MIVGIDEVGRGCWAGPLVAGAVLLGAPISGLKDSKKLSKAQRERLDAEIRVMATGFGIGWVTAQEIDTIGLTAAVRLAMERACEQITAPYEQIIIDGDLNFFADNPKASTLIGGDNLVPAISAASIIAKVARDRYMAEQSTHYPGYGFEKHVGYGTAAHSAALKLLGVTDMHRKSFKPVRALLT
jgi:ribonuclease HII